MPNLKQDLKKYSSIKRKKTNEWFFKTGKGEYGEGDIFIGVSMPNLRQLAKSRKDVSFMEIQPLLNSKIHEERMLGLLILVYKYEMSSELDRSTIFEFYLKNLNAINNWDLVDVTCPRIVGRHILENGRKNPLIEGKLFDLAHSENLWEKRIAIVSTSYFIKNGRFIETLEICKILLKDKHDLTHKAMGWMLREIWKKDNKVTEEFLKKNYEKIPRTTLRYAIERMEEKKRKAYLIGEF